MGFRWGLQKRLYIIGPVPASLRVAEREAKGMEILGLGVWPKLSQCGRSCSTATPLALSPIGVPSPDQQPLLLKSTEP